VTTTQLGRISVPRNILPADGRFCSGPSKIRPAQIEALVASSTTLLGTSHRKAPVRELVGSVRRGLFELFSLPQGWEIVLGNGGTTVFWDAATFGLIDRRSHHLVFGEFSGKFAAACAAAPHLDDPIVVRAEAGEHPAPVAADGIDVYALTHNETSTGVAMTLSRPAGGDDALVAVDATSAAGGIGWDAGEVDVYYFAPQKCFASDGGLWLAACSPMAVERIERIAAGDRWCPASLDLGIALENSRLDQTYNTPALATLVLLDSQLHWMLEHGGLDFAAGRSRAATDHIYGWADARDWATPFVDDPAKRSPVVSTIDFDTSIDAAHLTSVLAANGVLDTDSYRKLGRNQLRLGVYPAVELDDVIALTNTIDWLIENHRNALAP